LDLAQRVAGWASNGEEVEVFASRSRTTSVRAYRGEVESLTSAAPSGVGIRVVAGPRQGFASCGTLNEAALAETLVEARDNATFTAPDECVGLARADGVGAATLDVCRRDLATVSTATKVELAIDLERRALTADPRITGVRTATYRDGLAEDAIATTTGIAASCEVSYCSASVETLAEDGGVTQNGFGYDVARHPDLLDLGRAANDAVQRAVRLLGATKPLSRRLTVILDPEVTAALLGIVGGTLSGEAVLKGRSLFAGRLGEMVAAPAVTLVDDPTDARSLGAEQYDGEGLARRRNVLMADGVLKGYLYHTYAAHRAGTVSTGSASRGYASPPSVGAPSLSLMPGGKGQEALVGEVGEGLLVQDVSGLHSGVNPVSGDFSVGATGLMIRGGALAEPVREATIASTLQRMLLDVVAVGADLRWMPGGAGGVSLVVADVSLGGS
jgi:PmbA protein